MLLKETKFSTISLVLYFLFVSVFLIYYAKLKPSVIIYSEKSKKIEKKLKGNCNKNLFNLDDKSYDEFNYGQNKKNHSFELNIYFDNYKSSKKMELNVDKIFACLSNYKKIKAKKIKRVIKHEGDKKIYYYLNPQDKIHLKQEGKYQIDIEFEDKFKMEELLKLRFKTPSIKNANRFDNLKYYNNIDIVFPWIFNFEICKEEIKSLEYKDNLIFKIPLKANNIHGNIFGLSIDDLEMFSDNLVKEVETKRILFSDINYNFENVSIGEKRSIYSFIKKLGENSLVTNPLSKNKEINKYLYILINKESLEKSDYIQLKINDLNIKEDIHLKNIKKKRI